MPWTNQRPPHPPLRRNSHPKPNLQKGYMQKAYRLQLRGGWGCWIRLELLGCARARPSPPFPPGLRLFLFFSVRDFPHSRSSGQGSGGKKGGDKQMNSRPKKMVSSFVLSGLSPHCIPLFLKCFVSFLVWASRTYVIRSSYYRART